MDRRTYQTEYVKEGFGPEKNRSPKKTEDYLDNVEIGLDWVEFSIVELRKSIDSFFYMGVISLILLGLILWRVW